MAQCGRRLFGRWRGQTARVTELLPRFDMRLLTWTDRQNEAALSGGGLSGGGGGWTNLSNVHHTNAK